ncbi:TlpA disulfide reductase family protein [Paucibacter sp. JuS9]|uniref:TlpA disulfide reductase family protein n=1 Tax=Paucibacter sp. JuS9 TaxID=3228748 RepID=UPI0037567F03
MKRRELLLGAAAALCTSAQADTIRRPWPKAQATPALSLPGHPDVKPWSLTEARGKVVLLNFWASWCEPCRAELPSLELLEASLGGEGLQVIAVNHRETDAALKRFLDQMPVSLQMLRDSDGATTRAFGVRAFPTTVIVDRSGQARLSVIGEFEWNSPDARQLVAPYLKGSK